MPSPAGAAAAPAATERASSRRPAAPRGGKPLGISRWVASAASVTGFFGIGAAIMWPQMAAEQQAAKHTMAAAQSSPPTTVGLVAPTPPAPAPIIQVIVRRVPAGAAANGSVPRGTQGATAERSEQGSTSAAATEEGSFQSLSTDREEQAPWTEEEASATGESSAPTPTAATGNGPLPTNGARLDQTAQPIAPFTVTPARPAVTAPAPTTPPPTPAPATRVVSGASK